MPLNDLPFSECGASSLTPCPVNRMVANSAATFRDGPALDHMAEAITSAPGC